MEREKEMAKQYEYTVASLYSAVVIWLPQRLQPEAPNCSLSAGNMQCMQTQGS